MADTPPLTGWQYVVLECVKMLVPILATLVIGGYAVHRIDKADGRIDQTDRVAHEAKAEAGKAVRVMYGKAPE